VLGAQYGVLGPQPSILRTQHGILRSELPIQREVGHDDTLAPPQQKINSTRRRSRHTSPASHNRTS
jgi:hypothetical protein